MLLLGTPMRLLIRDDFSLNFVWLIHNTRVILTVVCLLLWRAMTWITWIFKDVIIAEFCTLFNTWIFYSFEASTNSSLQIRVFNFLVRIFTDSICWAMARRRQSLFLNWAYCWLNHWGLSSTWIVIQKDDWPRIIGICLTGSIWSSMFHYDRRFACIMFHHDRWSSRWNTRLSFVSRWCPITCFSTWWSCVFVIATTFRASNNHLSRVIIRGVWIGLWNLITHYISCSRGIRWLLVLLSVLKLHTC